MVSVALAAAEEHATSAGMPQFESSMFQHQIIWSIISFLILLHLLRKHVLPAIKDLLDSRANTIEEDLERAKAARLEAEKAQDDLKKQLAAARQIAAETIEQARVDAARNRELALEALNAELNKKKSAAVDEIEAAKKKALDEIQSAIVDVAILATEKLISKTISTSTANAMVDEALAEIENQKPLH